VGGVGSGKTVCAANLILQSALYRGFYPGGIYWMSPTSETDLSCEPLRKSSDVHMLGAYSDDKIMALFHELEEGVHEAREEGTEPLPSLLVLDDCVGQLSEHSPINAELLRHRHRYCGILVLSQLWRKLPTPIRSQASMAIFFGTRDDKETQKVRDSFDGHFGNAAALLKEATKNSRHDFLLITQGRLEPAAYRGMFMERLD
jgi:hypothetical protein